jgi:hypothetical protein
MRGQVLVHIEFRGPCCCCKSGRDDHLSSRRKTQTPRRTRRHREGLRKQRGKKGRGLRCRWTSWTRGAETSPQPRPRAVVEGGRGRGRWCCLLLLRCLFLFLFLLLLPLDSSLGEKETVGWRDHSSPEGHGRKRGREGREEGRGGERGEGRGEEVKERKFVGKKRSAAVIKTITPRAFTCKTRISNLRKSTPSVKLR